MAFKDFLKFISYFLYPLCGILMGFLISLCPSISTYDGLRIIFVSGIIGCVIAISLVVRNILELL